MGKGIGGCSVHEQPGVSHVPTRVVDILTLRKQTISEMKNTTLAVLRSHTVPITVHPVWFTMRNQLGMGLIKHLVVVVALLYLRRVILCYGELHRQSEVVTMEMRQLVIW